MFYGVSVTDVEFSAFIICTLSVSVYCQTVKKITTCKNLRVDLGSSLAFCTFFSVLH